jgi:hypothetical protein
MSTQKGKWTCKILWDSGILNPIDEHKKTNLWLQGLKTKTTSFKNWLFGYKVSFNGYKLGSVC